MPFLEIIDRDAPQETRALATRTMTDGLCAAYAIKPEIVTCYYYSMTDYSYGHAGKHGAHAENFRIFIKVHAFPRSQDAKDSAAKAITEAAVSAYGAAPKDVVVYFLDRAPSDAYHAGQPST